MRSTAPQDSVRFLRILRNLPEGRTFLFGEPLSGLNRFRNQSSAMANLPQGMFK